MELAIFLLIDMQSKLWRWKKGSGGGKMFTETGCGIEYGNCKNVDALFFLQGRRQDETNFLHRENAELAFMYSFTREVGVSLNSLDVVLTAAKLLYNYFRYDLAVFSLSYDPKRVTAFSPLDDAGRMSSFLMSRGSFHGLKLREIKGYRHLGLATPVQARVPGNCPSVVEIAGEGINVTLQCGEEAEEKATHDLLTGLAESLTTAMRNALEHDRVKELAVRDSLTGLYNRRMLEEILGVEESKRAPAPLAILIIDVDDFKVINDTFGHPAGDRVLSVLGKLMQDNCRKENIVARYGGEEFAVLLTNAGLTAAAAVKTAERLRKVLGAQDFAFSGQKVRLTVSIGVAYRTGKSPAPENILVQADQALYQAKRSGKNQVSLHEAKHMQRCPVKDLHVSACSQP
jgi:diguanylate cyclase (GGDEF)-like protein